MFKEYFEVRDNEIDAQGVVNNANYLNYLAHTRHKFLDSIGVNFHEMATQNQMLFLVRCEIDYKYSLTPNTKFYVTCTIVQVGIRLVFEQDIYTLDGKLIAKSKNTGVCMSKNTNRPYIPEPIQKFLKLSHSK